MSEPKTKATNLSVEDFLSSVENDHRKKDSFQLLDMMTGITEEKAILWGSSIVGFGTYRYKYASGREGDWMITGFSPRKQNLSVYIMPGFNRYAELMSKLGKHKTGKSCLYINKLEDVDIEVLKELIDLSYRFMKEKYG